MIPPRSSTTSIIPYKTHQCAYIICRFLSALNRESTLRTKRNGLTGKGTRFVCSHCVLSLLWHTKFRSNIRFRVGVKYIPPPPMGTVQMLAVQIRLSTLHLRVFNVLFMRTGDLFGEYPDIERTACQHNRRAEYIPPLRDSQAFPDTER